MRAHGVTAATGVVLLMLSAVPAAAQPPQQVSTAPGVPVPLAVESGGHEDCTIGDPPEMKVVVGPAHGELALREGRLRRQGSACPAAPGYVVLYVPDADFNGPDMVSIEILEDGKAVTMAFDIIIKGKTTVPADGV
jgi:hypothetical protein